MSLPRLRPDLEFYRVEGFDIPTWVVRDPLTGNCFHLGEEEHFLLTHLPLVHTGSQPKETNAQTQQATRALRESFEQRFSPRRLSSAELSGLLLDWTMKELLIVEPHTEGTWRSHLGLAGQAVGQSAGKSGWVNPLVIRWRGWNPGRFLDWLTPRLAWIYTWPMAVLALVLLLWAGLVAVTEFPTIVNELSQLPLLFGPGHWLLVGLAIGLTKVLHELGHGVTCHHFGGRSTEMGVMWLAFIPCMYCNVTDAWTFREKSARVAVSAAGIVVDLLVASLCLLAWRYTVPGPWHALFLLLAVLGSLNSLLLNGNPLMRYDGYYIAADLLGKANMRAESQRQARQLGWRLMMGPRTQAAGEAFTPGMIGFGLASGVYLWVVLLLILLGLYRWLEPAGLEPLVVAAGGLLIPAQLIGTTRRLIPEGKREFPLRNRRIARLSGSLICLLLLLAAVILVPLPRRVPAMGVLVPRDSIPLIAEEGGVLREAVTPGSELRPDEVVYRMIYPELELQLLRLENEIHEHQARRQAIERKRPQLTDASEVLTLLAECTASLTQQAERLRERQAALIRSTDQATRLLPAPWTLPAGREGFSRTAATADEFSGSSETHSRWMSSDPLAPEQRGRYLPTGTYLGELASGKEYRILLVVEEQWARQLQIGSESLVFVPQQSGAALTGKLKQLAPGTRSRSRESPLDPASQILELHLARQPGSERAAYVIGFVDVESPADSQSLGYYQICPLRLSAPPASLGQRLWEGMRRLVEG